MQDPFILGSKGYQSTNINYLFERSRTSSMVISILIDIVGYKITMFEKMKQTQVIFL